jgi:hypothetical protein
MSLVPVGFLKENVYSSVHQTVVHGPLVVRGVPQAISEEKELQKFYHTLNELKINPYISVIKLLSLVDHQHKVGYNFSIFNRYF